MIPSSQHRPQFRNSLPPLPSDCILPKYDVPHLSTEINLESAIHKFSVESFQSDPFLGIPVEFSDLAIYSFEQTGDAYRPTDLLYMPDLVDQSQVLAVPSASTHIRPRQEEPVKSASVADPRRFYVRSPFYNSDRDPHIQEQLQSAFGGRVPPGAVCLIKRAPDLRGLQIRGAEVVNPTDRRKLLLLAQQKRFLKTIVLRPEADPSEPIPVTRGYQVAENQVRQRCYIHWNPEKTVCSIGRIDKRYHLKALSNKEMEEEEATARSVILLRGPNQEEPVDHSD
jgi:hypothetical protein